MEKTRERSFRLLLTAVCATWLLAATGCHTVSEATEPRAGVQPPGAPAAAALGKPQPAPRKATEAAAVASGSTGFVARKLQEMDRAVLEAISEAKLPGGVLWLEHRGAIYKRAYGRRAVAPASEIMEIDTIFDVASLTKVIATTPAVMWLIERGDLDLDVPVKDYLPEFRGPQRDKVTLRHLMTHTSGLPPEIPLAPLWAGYNQGIDLAIHQKLGFAPGTRFQYSDVNFILLAEIVRRRTGVPLDVFVSNRVYQPLGMTETFFLPKPCLKDRIAPTTQEGDGFLRGVVHDPTSRRMGGVAGHAGLFTTAKDLARYARMLLNQGTLEGRRIFKPQTVRMMTRVQSPPGVKAKRGLGWDIDSPYSGPRGRYFPVGSYGHTGWTGTSIWIDPTSRTFLIFLSNRNHPTEKGSVLALRRRLGTLAAEAIPGFVSKNAAPKRPPPERALSKQVEEEPPRPSRFPGVLNGIDVLEQEGFSRLAGMKVGLITNQTGQDRERRSTIELFRKAPEVQLKALFSPEHGIQGIRDGEVPDIVYPGSKIPVYSLYGSARRPGRDQLEGLDVLVFDLQDVGCRFYTYLSTMGYCMEAAAQQGIRFVVLDRVNPVNGLAVQGPMLAGTPSFTAFHPIPVRHGMTLGELATMIRAERHLGLDLEVIRLRNWKRGEWFDETGLPWTNPSPNMRSLTQATLYPGIGLLETTPLSVGRGTDTPFEVIGAPYIDDIELTEQLRRQGLPGVAFVPVEFTPGSSTFHGQTCHGVNIIVLDRDTLQPVRLGVALASILYRLYPKQFRLERLNQLLVHDGTIQAIREGKTIAEIQAMWAADLKAFARRRKDFLLYP